MANNRIKKDMKNIKKTFSRASKRLKRLFYMDYGKANNDPGYIPSFGAEMLETQRRRNLKKQKTLQK